MNPDHGPPGTVVNFFISIFDPHFGGGGFCINWGEANGPPGKRVADITIMDACKGEGYFVVPEDAAPGPHAVRVLTAASGPQRIFMVDGDQGVRQDAYPVSAGDPADPISTGRLPDTGMPALTGMTVILVACFGTGIAAASFLLRRRQWRVFRR